MKSILSMPAEFYQNIKPALSEVSKPQGEHLARFVMGLITSPNKTVEGITQKGVKAKHQSALNRFLTVSPWERKRVRNAVLRTAQQRRLLGSGCAFVLDDTLASLLATWQLQKKDLRAELTRTLSATIC